MKGIILAGGMGKRLRPLTHSGPKQLIPIANKPVLHYAIENLAEAGITEIGIIVGYTPERINAIKDACGDGTRWGARISYIEQDAPRGLAHAVWTAKDFLGDSNFVVYLGDNMIGGGIKKFVEDFRRSGADASLLLSESKTPEKFGVAEIAAGKIISVEEKPAHPRSNMVITGVYIFRQTLMDHIKGLKPSTRNELEITHAIQSLLASGGKIQYHVINDWWDDTGSYDDVLHANEMMLSSLKSLIEGTIDHKTKITGAVELGRNSVVRESIINGPVKIGMNCIIERSELGPNTSIGDNTVIRNGTIAGSIIIGDAVIEAAGKKIAGSLIGKRVSIAAHNGQFARLVLGEDSEVTI